MSSHGIKDRVAIVAMGCTDFGEHWDRSADDLIKSFYRRMQRFFAGQYFDYRQISRPST